MRSPRSSQSLLITTLSRPIHKFEASYLTGGTPRLVLPDLRKEGSTASSAEGMSYDWAIVSSSLDSGEGEFLSVRGLGRVRGRILYL